MQRNREVNPELQNCLYTGMVISSCQTEEQLQVALKWAEKIRKSCCDKEIKLLFTAVMATSKTCFYGRLHWKEKYEKLKRLLRGEK